MKKPLNIPPPPIGDTPTLPGEMYDFDDHEEHDDVVDDKPISIPYVVEDCPF